ncbi:copper transport protein ATOX1 [Astyanax mexicanus]|uniref:Copper transport protein ATOX1 n=1 Tax=Astyanax mexicanus TaxID=7994 RepID=A0A8T2LNM1_ASTMX|nr:copper transport protein ATOX1 [Astyanax mexicanus]
MVIHASESGRSYRIMATHEFFVDMTCEGCSGAVTRVLKKIDVKFDIDLPNKKVFIESDKDKDAQHLTAFLHHVVIPDKIMDGCVITLFKNEVCDCGDQWNKLLKPVLMCTMIINSNAN